jgi:glycosidase
MLNFISKLVELRNHHPALQSGRMELIPAKELPRNVLGYYRSDEKEKLAVLINFSKQEKRMQLNVGGFSKLLSTDKNMADRFERTIVLKPFSGFIAKVR